MYPYKVYWLLGEKDGLDSQLAKPNKTINRTYIIN